MSSLQGLLGRGTTLTLKLLLFGIFEYDKVEGEGGNDTMYKIWKVVMWQMRRP